MKENSNIDRIFRDEALKFKASVPVGIWDRLITDLKKRKVKRKRRFLFFLFSSIIFCGALFLLFKESLMPDRYYNELLITKDSTINNPISKFVETQVLSKEVIETVPEIEKDFITRIQNLEQEKIIKDTTKRQDVVEEFITDTSYRTERNISDKAETAVDTTSGLDNITADTVTKTDVNKKRDEAEEKKPKVKKDDSRDHVLSIGLTLGPSWSYRNTTMANPDNSAIAISDNEKAKFNFNAELFIQYHLSKKITLTSGLSLFSFGHEGDFFVENKNLNYIHLDNFGYTSAGFYSVENFEDILKDAGYNSVNCLEKFKKISYSSRVIDIPVMIKYNVSNKKMNLFFSSGFNAAFILDSKVDIILEGKTYSFGVPEDIRKNLFGFTIGAGLYYRLSNKISVCLEPKYKYYFTSLNESKDFKYYPYVFSVNTGILINIGSKPTQEFK